MGLVDRRKCVMSKELASKNRINLLVNESLRIEQRGKKANSVADLLLNNRKRHYNDMVEKKRRLKQKKEEEEYAMVVANDFKKNLKESKSKIKADMKFMRESRCNLSKSETMQRELDINQAKLDTYNDKRKNYSYIKNITNVIAEKKEIAVKEKKDKTIKVFEGHIEQEKLKITDSFKSIQKLRNKELNVIDKLKAMSQLQAESIRKLE